jgi:hypothetical protein
MLLPAIVRHGPRPGARHATDPPPASVTDETGIGMDFRNRVTWGA